MNYLANDELCFQLKGKDTMYLEQEKIKAMDANLKIKTTSSRIKRRCSKRRTSRLEEIT
jgi:hypothetical protein